MAHVECVIEIYNFHLKTLITMLNIFQRTAFLLIIVIIRAAVDVHQHHQVMVYYPLRQHS